MLSFRAPAVARAAAARIVSGAARRSRTHNAAAAAVASATCCSSAVLRRQLHVAAPTSAARTTRPSEEACAAETGDLVGAAAAAASGTANARPPAAPVVASTYSLPAIGSDSHFDLVVIGSGPSGQKCAIDAAKKGKRVCVVDKVGMFGGVCIHTGTIPSKTFREAILHVTAHNQRGFGGEVMARSATLSRDVLDRVKKVEQWETETILRQLHRNKVMTIAGTARFIDPNHIEVRTDSTQTLTSPAGHTKLSSLGTGAVTTLAATNTVSASSPFTVAGSGHSAPSGPIPSAALDNPSASSFSTSHVIRGDKFLIAAGSRPVRNPNYPWHSPLVFDSDAILSNPTWGEIKQLIVVGAGVIALEYASMFNTLPNCKVTIIDERPSFLDFIDGEIIDTLKYVMRRQGATFLLGEKVNKVSILQAQAGAGNGAQQVRVDLDSGKDVVGDALFYAVGRQAESDSLNLDAAKVSLGKRGLIPVNEYFQTNVPHIYASGDIIGFPALASTSMEQGRLCSQHMFGKATKMKPVFPYGIYTIPEISVVSRVIRALRECR